MLRIELNFYEATWGELREFVNAGEHMPDDTLLEPAVSEFSDNQTGFMLTMATPDKDA